MDINIGKMNTYLKDDYVDRKNESDIITLKMTKRGGTMESTSLSFQYEDKGMMQELLENVNAVLKDSDAAEEKKIVKEFLQKASKVFGFVVLGDSAVGKTTLLRQLFGEELIEDIIPTTEIIDYRFGEEAGKYQVNEAVTRIFKPLESIKGISIVDMPGTDQINNATQRETVQQFIQKSDVLIVAFPGDSVKSFGIWDLLENIESRKVVFILTKADMYSEEIIEQNRNKLRQYMQDANIDAPVYTSKTLEEFKDYINRNIIGTNPGLRKQRENVLELKGMLNEVKHSFELRKRQYEADIAVVNRINTAMDSFLISSDDKINGLKQSLRNEINTAIDAYEAEIVTKLNPTQIKERFPKGYTDFVDYLNFVNESYRRQMTNNVDRKTQEAIRSYLSELEIVFDQATGYFRERESMLTLEDKFYGSISKSKQQMVSKAGNDLQETKTYYGKLTDASAELFMKIWAERDKYDKKVNKAAMTGAGAGAVAGGGAVAGVAAIVGVANAAEGASLLTAAVTGITSAGLWPVVAAVVGAVFIAKMAKKISSAKNMTEMERCVQEAISDFRIEVSRTKNQMTDQIMETIDAIFKRELESADKTFLDFRMSVNIDAKNIPLLEDRMDKINVLMDKIEKIEKERSLEC